MNHTRCLREQLPRIKRPKSANPTPPDSAASPAKKRIRKSRAKDQSLPTVVKEKTPKIKSDPTLEIAVWKDIPDWGESTACPLLAMPGKILDRILDVDGPLHPRDWIALAGVNRFFRNRLDDEVFHDIWYHHYEEDCPTGQPRPADQPGSHIFTREQIIAKPPKAPSPTKKKTKSPFPIPRGPRDKWTQDDYIKYKIAKRNYYITQMSARIDQEEQAALKAIRDAIINPGPIKHIKTGKAMSLNPVYMMVPGRKEGEIAPEKDYSGLPVIDRAKAMKDKAEKTEKAVARVKAKSKVEKEKLEAMRFRLEGEVDHAPSWARVIQGQVWEVPDSDSEDDLGAEQEKKYDREGNEIIANPGWRAKVVSQINDDWINQAEAKRDYHVSIPELQGLRHALVRNPLNIRQPQMMFLRAAVGALALRSHGGVSGHYTHVDKHATASQKAQATKKAKLEKDIAEGRPPTPKKRKGPRPSAGISSRAYQEARNFDYAYDAYDSDESDGFGKGGCDDCMELWVHGNGPPNGICDHAGGGGT